MKIGLVGPSYQERSLPFDAQRTVNFYPVFDEYGGKEVASLYGTPGLTLFATAGSGPIRGMFHSANGRAFAVSGNTLYEISSAGAATSMGTLNTSAGIVSLAEVPAQLAICDGEDLYTLTYATNGYSQVADADLPSSVGYVDSIDNYFVVTQNDTGKFYISAANDGTSWDALDFATAESSPDSLLACVNAVGQLWLFGEHTTEIWTNTGDSVFPFQRIAGAKMETGILAKHTAVTVDGTVVWVGQDKMGKGIVFRASGFSPQRISTSPIEKIIQDADNAENMRAYAYQEDGHVFYVLTGGGLETTLVYDFSTQLWHERAYLTTEGVFGQHLGCCAMFIFDKVLVGSRLDGSIYDMSLDYYDDNGDEIASERIYTHISNEGKRMKFSGLEVGFEVGVGLQSGQGSDPQATLYISTDGGRTWSGGYSKSIGAVGQYKKKVMWRRLGVAEQMTFKIRITDPVKRAVTGSYLV